MKVKDQERFCYMARSHFEDSFQSQKIILSLQIQASGERKVAIATLRSGMLVAAAQNKLMMEGGL